MKVSPEESGAHHDPSYIEQCHSTVNHVGVLNYSKQHQCQKLSSDMGHHNHSGKTHEAPRIWVHPYSPETHIKTHLVNFQEPSGPFI